MGKPTGFMEFERELPEDRTPLERVKDWREFHEQFSEAKLQQQGVKLIVAETYQDHSMAQQIATQAGAQLLLLPAAVSQREGIHDYFQLFDRIYGQLAKALKGAGV